jgi:hypothetical protein
MRRIRFGRVKMPLMLVLVRNMKLDILSLPIRSSSAKARSVFKMACAELTHDCMSDETGGESDKPCVICVFDCSICICRAHMICGLVVRTTHCHKVSHYSISQKRQHTWWYCRSSLVAIREALLIESRKWLLMILLRSRFNSARFLRIDWVLLKRVPS